MRGPVANQHQPPDNPVFWHRLQAIRYASLCEESAAGPLIVEHYQLQVLRETPKGVWLDWGGGKGRFVRRDAKRQWASPTFEQAKEKFIRRTERRCAILQAQIDDARMSISIAKELQPRKPPTTDELQAIP